MARISVDEEMTLEEDMTVEEDVKVDDNLITRMRKQIAANATASASVGNTTTVSQPIMPLVAIYHLDTGGGDATIIIGSEKHMFVDTGFGSAPGRMHNLTEKLCKSGPAYISISHFDKDHFYGMGYLWLKYRNAKIITPADPKELRWAAHGLLCRKYGKPDDFDSADTDLVTRLQMMFGINEGGKTGAAKRKADDALTDGNSLLPPRVPVPACSGGKCDTVTTAIKITDFFERKPADPIQLGDGVVVTSIDTGFGAASLADLRENNDSSLAWQLSAGGINYYTAGDLEDNEAAVNVADIHIIKCGHHGSEAATKNAFLRKSAAKVAIIQGAHHGYNHPHADVLHRLKEKNLDVYATGIEVDYGARALGRLVSAGGTRHAGDIVIVIWENRHFSVCYMKDDVLNIRTYRNREVLEDAAAAPFDAVIRASLPLGTYTTLTEAMNTELWEKRANVPMPLPKFDEYKLKEIDGVPVERAPRQIRLCEFDDCTAEGMNNCSGCTTLLCSQHWKNFSCPKGSHCIKRAKNKESKELKYTPRPSKRRRMEPPPGGL